MFKCLECGEIFEEPEIYEEHHPYGMGYATESFACCPYCGSNFEEAAQCEICGGEFLEEELNGGCVCDDCIEEYKRDFKTCYAISEAAPKEEIKINALLASLVSVSKIEAVLYHILKEVECVDCSAFINQDKDWFAEKLVEEVSK